MLWKCIYMWNGGISLIEGCISFISRELLKKSFKGLNTIYKTSILKTLGLKIKFSKLTRVNKYLLNAWGHIDNLAKVSVMTSLDLYC
jgi:hypothetical protein